MEGSANANMPESDGDGNIEDYDEDLNSDNSVKAEKRSAVVLPPPKKGILKNASEPALKKRIVWDEENIAITEAQKSSTMKIDEPKTPYHYYDSSEEEAEEGQDKWNHLESVAEKMKELQEKHPEWDRDRESRSESDESGSGRSDNDIDNDEDENDPEAQARRRAFREKRRQHYNEYQMVKALQKKGTEEEEDQQQTSKCPIRNTDAMVDDDAANDGDSDD